jgi:hypothetical protein
MGWSGTLLASPAQKPRPTRTSISMLNFFSSPDMVLIVVGFAPPPMV